MNDRNIGYDAAEPPEAEAKTYCDVCGEGIYEGETYYVIHGKRICENCVDELRVIA